MQTKSNLQFENRPPKIKAKILEVFEDLKNSSNDLWSFKGKSQYLLSGINEYHLIRALILANPQQKEFYILDVGAGDFRFNYFLSEFLNQSDLPKDIKIHIVGIRGEKLESIKNDCTQNGICMSYCLGAFQIENFHEELAASIFDLNKPYDVIVSRWSLRHLVDPVEIFRQLYNQLRSHTGLLLADGFFYARNNCSHENTDMQHLLLETNAPFLIYPYNIDRSLDQFVLQRIDEKECSTSIACTGELIPLNSAGCMVNSKSLTCYKTSKPDPELPELQDGLNGDQHLYDLLLSYDAIEKDWYFTGDPGNRRKFETIKYAGPFKPIHSALATENQTPDPITQAALDIHSNSPLFVIPEHLLSRPGFDAEHYQRCMSFLSNK